MGTTGWGTGDGASTGVGVKELGGATGAGGGLTGAGGAKDPGG